MEPLPINIYLCERFLFAHHRNLFLITKHSRKKEHNAKGGMMRKGRGPHGKTDEELLKQRYPGQFRNESNALDPGSYSEGRARGGFVKKAGGTKRVPGSGAATKGTNFEGIF